MLHINALNIKGVAVNMFAATVMLAATSCGSKQEMPQAGAPQLAVVTVAPTTSALESSFPATIKGKTDIDIRPQVTGFITKVHVDEGQQVRKGQLLFTLDQVQYQAAVDQAQASVNSAETAVATAQITADSNRRLFEKNIISEHARQLSDNQLASAKAALSQAKASLVNARKNLAYTLVTSPSDGVVGSIPNREGSLASPSGQALTTVSDNSDVYAYFSLNEKDLIELTGNGATTLQQAIAEMPEVKLRLANGTVYPLPGKVATVSGVIDSSTGSANVRALFKNSNGMLRSGSTGAVLIPRNEENIIIIPQKATFEIQDRRFVFTVDADNVLHTTPVTVSAHSDGKNFIVTSGLNAGDRVVVEGVGVKTSDGLTIQPVDAAAKAQQEQQTAQQAQQAGQK